MEKSLKKLLYLSIAFEILIFVKNYSPVEVFANNCSSLVLNFSSNPSKLPLGLVIRKITNHKIKRL
jgi:hypothetical protein